jgi:transcriptional regulator with XRE-family HTH domain
MSSFREFLRDVEAEAKREGPQAVAEAEAFRAHFQLARELIQRRQELGWSQRALAKQSGVQQAEISRIEQGNANPTFRTIQVLANALGAEIHLQARRVRGVRRGSKSTARLGRAAYTGRKAKERRK